MEPAAEGVYQFRIPMPVSQIRPSSRERYTLVYAIETSDGWVMVDAGMDSEAGLEALRRQIPEAGLDPRDFSLIVVTHGHTDHFGLAAKARELTGAPIAIHRADATNPYVLTFDPGAGPPEVDVLLEGGEELVPGSGLWTIWTPGHTPGHTCIHDRERRLLFAGDHVLPVTTPNVSRYPTDTGNPLQDFIDAHRALADLDVEMVHPAHEYSFADLRSRVDEIIEHHHERADEILAAAAEGPRSAAGNRLAHQLERGDVAGDERRHAEHGDLGDQRSPPLPRARGTADRAGTRPAGADRGVRGGIRRRAAEPDRAGRLRPPRPADAGERATRAGRL